MGEVCTVLTGGGVERLTSYMEPAGGWRRGLTPQLHFLVFYAAQLCQSSFPCVSVSMQTRPNLPVSDDLSCTTSTEYKQRLGVLSLFFQSGSCVLHQWNQEELLFLIFDDKNNKHTSKQENLVVFKCCGPPCNI